MYSQKLVRRFAILASTFAIIQSAIWFLGSLLVILLFYDFLSLDFDDGSLPDLVFELFMDQNDDTIILFVYIYAVLSLVLCVISSLIINAIVAKYETKIHKLYVSWAVNIIILSVVDIVLTCFLGRDLYNQSQPSQDVIYAYTIAILISIRELLFG
ncbi:hypothetical protein HHI36_020863 [Cryptolaemus montrouzieri]|uniref:Uncharacterized protein n=1 Tax=Cryptolaemus montrouzieri TaxID=559131 RepID=A0ABD2NC48_9CUCU